MKKILITTGLVISLFILSGVFRATASGALPCLECHELEAKEDGLKYAHKDVACEDCHSDITFDEDPHSRSVLSSRQICGNCHEEEYSLLQNSIHGEKKNRKEIYAIECVDCHGNHSIQISRNRTENPIRGKISAVCADCHASVKFVEVSGGVYSRKVYVEYENSVHGQSVGKGVVAAAVCTDCHGSHNIMNPLEDGSTVSRNNVASTCGECHYGIFMKYRKSIHYAALQKGISRSPVCIDCHGIHTIASIMENDDISGAGGRELVFGSCIRCHEDVRLNREYQVETARVSSYLNSYHGLAARQGETTVADCGSCHGVHMVLPSDNPESYVNINNLATTCGKCHPKAGENFAGGLVHITGTEDSAHNYDKIIFYIKWIYIFLIIITISGMFIHNFLDFAYKLKLHFSGNMHRNIERKGVFFERLTLNERVQHFLLLSSFTILVLTGFALVFPDSWWTAPFKIIERGESARGLIHRIASLVMMGVAFYHIYFISATDRGKFELRSMIPTDKDLKDMAANLLFLAGLRNEKPKYERFNYIEKSEYWALVWGTAVMAVTGLILWFEEEVMLIVPKIVVDIAQIVHYYEAWLATLAILVWHIYYVIFNPSTYPMNWCWITGKISIEEMEEEHPLELEKNKEKTGDERTG